MGSVPGTETNKNVYCYGKKEYINMHFLKYPYIDAPAMTCNVGINLKNCPFIDCKYHLDHTSEKDYLKELN
jgi:hypothetical protein